MKTRMMEQLDQQKRKVDFNTYDISVKELITMTTEKIINISPEYQRQFRWNRAKQSALVESVLLGIPIPSLFMATNADGSWELIDGVQRLSSLINFAGSDEARVYIGKTTPLKLEQLKKLDTFNGKGFLELPGAVQLNFRLAPIKITTLSDKSDLDVRFDLFERLNTGGVRLTDQEIRSCIYRGAFSDFLKRLGRHPAFLTAVRLPREKESDGTREEFVLRFFAFLYKYKRFEHSVVDFLNSYMAEASKEFDYAQNQNLFETVFTTLARIPGGISRRRTTTPVNLFEAIAVGAALSQIEAGHITLNNMDTWINSPDLLRLTTGATNSKPKVEGRIEYCRDRFAGR